MYLSLYIVLVAIAILYGVNNWEIVESACDETDFSNEHYKYKQVMIQPGFVHMHKKQVPSFIFVVTMVSVGRKQGEYCIEFSLFLSLEWEICSVCCGCQFLPW